MQRVTGNGINRRDSERIGFSIKKTAKVGQLSGFVF